MLGRLRVPVHDTSAYALHSGRIGAATALAALGHTDSAIMAAGRWASTAFMVYVRPSIDESERVSAALLEGHTNIQP